MSLNPIKMSAEFFKQLEDLVLSSTDDSGHQTVAEVLRDAGVPTASIAILDNGHISSHCISSRDDNTETLFQACSISKPTAGVVAMRLVDLGYFSVTDKIRNLLPENIVRLLSRDVRTEAAFNTVTVAQLMSHTAGLSVSSFPGYPDVNDVPTVSQLLEGGNHSDTMRIRFVSPPGADFMYSGGGITILQCLMEHTTGMAFSDIMQKHLFDPLGMTRSCYTLLSGEDNASRCYYNGYRECENQWHYMPELAAAGLWTTPTDLLKLIRGVQKSLQGDGILQKATAELMLLRVTKDIALTWFIKSIGFCHSGGNLPGWICYAFGYADLPWNQNDEYKPEIPSGCGFAIMTNSASGLVPMWKLLHAIPYLKGWPDASVAHGASDYKAPFRASNAQVDERWKDWIGRWTQKWLIREDKGEPVAGLEDGVVFKLRPAAIPPRRYTSESMSIDLILDGTEIMLRLGFKDEKRIVELWNGATGSCETLQLVEGENRLQDNSAGVAA